MRDERNAGTPVAVGFSGTLRPDQEAAVAAVLKHDDGVLCAPTAFGKTVTAAAIIARRGVNSLVLVHRTELLKQWHPPLDTLVLAMPVSCKGTLAQYAGRLHRELASKTDVRIIDFLDADHPALLRIWDKRQRGYQAMGYRVDSGMPSVGRLEG